jgi:hypothetical protein
LDATAKADCGQGELFNKAAAIHAAVPHMLATLRASGDLGLPPGHGEKWLLRMLFVEPLTLALWCFPGVIIFQDGNALKSSEQLNASSASLERLEGNALQIDQIVDR